MNRIYGRQIVKKTNIAGTVPTINVSATTDIYDGEFFLNTVDKRLWVRSDDEIIEITAPEYAGGNDTEVQFNDAASFAGDSTFVFNKTTKEVGAQTISLSRDIKLTNTTNASQYGVIQKNGKRFIHDFNYGNNGSATTEGRNIFIGEESGNFTMGSMAQRSYYSSHITAIGYGALQNNTLGYKNSAIGAYTLQNNTTGSQNTAIGVYTLQYNTGGGYNSAIGAYTLQNNTGGWYNSAIGAYTLQNNTSGGYNSAIGAYTLQNNTSGGYNSAIGHYTLQHNTSGWYNSAIGAYTLQHNTSGWYNSAIGYNAGRYLANGSTSRTTGDNGLYLGAESKASADDTTNEIVIGYNATGLGSNTVVLGNSAITITRLQGSVGIGTDAPAAKLQVIGDCRFGGATDYTEFEADGTRHAVGAATTWRDESNNLVGQKLESPSSDIVNNYTECTLDFKTSATYNVDFAFMNIQINHDWKIGSRIYAHLHWIQEEEYTPNWIITYRWQINGGEKQTIWTPLVLNNNAFSWVSGSLNQISTFPDIEPPLGAGLSDILQIKLHRDTNNDSLAFGDIDNYTLTAQAYSFDIHIECDTDGSRSEYTK